MKIKFCVWLVFGKPEIKNVDNAKVTKNPDGRYTISAKSPDGNLYTNCAIFDPAGRFFYND